ncbi:MAG: thioredoxin domain-containing protein [Oscillospiraceae bacterium]|jgi:predicted DsbA family dithiol-disulfide isomerase|nr:thioredoxin domain-containing protein [Oscillospiraceae bacterium]
MSKLEVFFDYSCPFCRTGYGYLTELLPDFPNAQIELLPVEAHPRNEEPEHRPYVDLAVQGGLFVKAVGGDEYAFAARMFTQAGDDRMAFENIDALTICAADAGIDAAAFKSALQSGTYAAAQLAANDYAYETQKVWAVPTFVCGDKRIDAVGNVGVTKDQVRDLLQELFG